MLYEPKRAPPPMPAPKRNAQYDAGDVAAFLGATDPACNVLQIILDYRKYSAAWPTIPQGTKDLGIGKFWCDPTVLAIFGDSRALVDVALWYATRATSSVAVERVFGVMRNMESDLNHRLSDESINVEMLARCNGWIVERALARISAKRGAART